MFESVDLFVQAVDRCIQLLTLRANSRRQLFTEIVEPLFKDLEPVVDDYFTLFNSSIQIVAETKKHDVYSALERIRNRREQMLLARIKVKQFSAVLESTTKDERLVEFANAIQRIFYSTQRIDRKASRSDVVVELLDTIAQDQIGEWKGVVIEEIRRTKDEVATAWLAVAQRYAAIRLHSLR